MMNDVNQYFRQIAKQSVLVVLVFVMGVGCRGYRSSEPPVHLNPNMDFQAKYKSQSLSLTPPENTIPWGTIFNERRGFVEKESFYTGISDGQYIRKAPVSIDETLLDRGQERFNIYCAVCHSKTGNGGTPVIQRGYVPPPKLSDSRLLRVSDGYLFNVITNGVRSMPAYKSQVSVEDRWAIVVYIRALQKMYFGRMQDVPYSERSRSE
jgi:mono/diheme cytochrome c family protein